MITFHVLCWDNIPENFKNAHKSVVEHIGIPVQYHYENISAGDLMDRILLEAEEDEIIGFMDIDCIPLSYNKVQEWIDYAIKNNTFIGPAQTTNRPENFWHTYAAAAFLIVPKKVWLELGQPTFQEIYPWDYSEILTVAAEQNGKKYRAVYPKCFDKPSPQGAWYLNNYGFYGTGTVYDDTIYHLFQSRLGTNQELFIKRCNEVLNNTFSTESFIDCQSKTYDGPIWYMNAPRS